MGMARTIMSNDNFSQKQQEASQVMTALQLMQTPAVVPLAVQEFFAQCIQACDESAEVMYSFDVNTASPAPLQASPANQHAVFVFEDSVHALELATPASPQGFDAGLDRPTAIATDMASHAEGAALASSQHLAHAHPAHTEHTPPTHTSVSAGGFIPVNTQPATSPHAPAATNGPHWNSASGWGQADVASALEQMLGSSLNPSTEQSQGAAPWYLQSMGFETAWRHGFTGQGVVIADIDTGIDLSNAHLMKDITLSSFSKNFIEDNSNIQDDNGHGTVTAAEMVADSDGGIGIQGGAYGAELMVLKALGANGSGTHEDICEAVIYAVDHGAQVINLSLGQTLPNQDLRVAMQYANDHNVVVVAAAGNQGTVIPEFPAAYAKQMADVIAVGASQVSNDGYALASFSNHSGGDTPYNFVDALGVGLTATSLDGDRHVWNGTSMAAPLVAAEAAVLTSTHAGWTAAQIVQDIVQSAHTLAAHSAPSTAQGDASYPPMDNPWHAMGYVPTEQYY